MPRAISPGPAGLKFWRAPGLAADNTVDIDYLPASIGDQFNPWGPKRPVQDWVCGVSPSLIALAIPPDTTNLPAGVADSFYPWGPRRGNPYSTWFSALHIPQPITLIAADGSYTLTGASAAQAFGQAAGSGSYALTGSAAGQAFGYAAGSGAYTLTGSAAALALGHVAGGGSYSLTGSNAVLALGLGAGAGSYTITGADAGLTIPGGLAAAAGSYTLTGSDAALTVSGGAVDYLPAGMSGGYVPWGRRFPINLRSLTGRPLSAAPPVVLTVAGGSYAITGSAISFVIVTPADTTNLPAGATNWFNPWRRPYPVSLRTGINPATTAAAAPFTLSADSGSYALTGASAGQTLGLTANSGSYTVSGTAAVLARGFAAGAGAYAITGTDANLVQAGAITLTCGAGSYTLTGGADVTFLGITPPTVEQPGGNYAGVVVGAGRGRMIRRRKRGELDLEQPPDLEPPPLAPAPPDLPPPAPGPKPPDLLPPQPGLMADMPMPQPKPLPPHVDEDEDEIALLLGLIS